MRRAEIKDGCGREPWLGNYRSRPVPFYGRKGGRVAMVADL